MTVIATTVAPKWGFREVAIETAIQSPQRQGDYYMVPLVSYTSSGEPTQWAVALRIPDFSGLSMEDSNALLAKVADSAGKVATIVPIYFGRGTAEWGDSYRPYLARVAKAQQGTIWRSLMTALWYLERWDDPVCQAWRACRMYGYVVPRGFWEEAPHEG